MDKINSRNWYAIAYPHPHVDILKFIEELSIPNAISPMQTNRKTLKDLHNSQTKKRHS